ncbi:unnamed protein product [Cyprideis torosa]|uniref:Uncharacterized protein n=1 Tax=Cyprideis torosa TaxID=163714 RepID=A0A7R8W4H4_9CRUS|nr:unnamed protein product [Cyprideis torosa]CAG0883154.1 unnamed protein product [Cyprideis torosa]
MMDKKSPHYDKKEYWDKRFQDEEEYDWLSCYAVLRDVIKHFVGKDQRILILGCGNSQLGHEMYEDGYKCITNVDYSQVVIDKMASKYPTMRWCCGDVRNLLLRESNENPEHEGTAAQGLFMANSFDCAIEKATLDALLVNEKSMWSISPGGQRDIEMVLRGVYDILGPDGVFLSMSFHLPHFRLPTYYKVGVPWALGHMEIQGKSLPFYCYSMKKGETQDPKSKDFDEQPLWLVFLASTGFPLASLCALSLLIGMSLAMGTGPFKSCKFQPYASPAARGRETKEPSKHSKAKSKQSKLKSKHSKKSKSKQSKSKLSSKSVQPSAKKGNKRIRDTVSEMESKRRRGLPSK